MEDELDISSDLNGGDETAGTAVDNGINVPPAGQEPAAKPVQIDEPKPVDKPLSLRDQLSAAAKASAGEATPDNAQQGRTPDGKFAPTDVAAAAAVLDPNAQQQQQQPVQAPAGLTPAEVQQFSTLPAELQQFVARTMERAEQSATQSAGYAQIEQVIAPRRQAWAMNGMSEAQAVTQLLALSDFASKDPSGFIKYFAQQRSIDLENLVFDQDEPIDPNVQQLQNQVQSLSQQLQGMTTQQQQAQHAAIVDEITAFGQAKDAKGVALHPYFDEMGRGMLPYLQAAMAEFGAHKPRGEVLKIAYDNACWAIPAIREKMQKAANDAAEAQRILDAAEQAKRAKLASVSMPSGTPKGDAVASQSQARTLRDQIREAVAASGS